MGLLRLLGFATLPCGCLIGRYREVACERELSYVEEKGTACPVHQHRRNHTVAVMREARFEFQQPASTPWQTAGTS